MAEHSTTPPSSRPAESQAGQIAESALHAAQTAVESLKGDLGVDTARGSSPSPAVLPDFRESQPGAEGPKGIELLSEVNLNVRIELGRTRMMVDDVLRLSDGAVVELDKPAGDPVDVYVNNRLVAYGEILVLNDAFCVRINEIVSKPGE